MEVVDLVLTICLLSDPTSCREERLHFESRGGLHNCMFLAPTEIAKWSGDHPKVKVVRWRCDYPSKDLEL
ncbi:hypothetical protein [Phyllobacterium endophyticum]|jgi:hypothetical protein|uniref:Uncharacterized protein n=1 Tax=Phyllobacterium endophyticum TaxID=1149773 RepID=A0A2P7AMA9_9HYPH|nr:hypothetical protein [Phyllobacterium endophyticum]MBB3238449.1 hypothetical protein [Phyllobacterium endophyticum]PSH55342.1 hypothetical protein CU100_22000 [Phyllobacterium endophyticum]TXR48745.1 hypothetical protein FVA77_12385 [Phyllobacterium endophyticum]TYR43122.1 hypothetical protein FY050_04980 [Phyllobacterium endophyticum]